MQATIRLEEINMSYSFNTDLFGITLLVTGEFSPEEKHTFDYPGCSASFEIDTVEHKGEQIEIDLFADYAISLIVDAAFESASNAAQDCADERASERAEARRQE
jgi:hypothetical protein